MHRGVVLAVLCASIAAACGGTATSPTALSTATAGDPKTENFTGTIDVGGTSVSNFTVTAGGQNVSITLTAAGPPATIYMGLGVGTPALDGTCSLFSNAVTLTPAGTSPQLSGTTAAGSYCVAVFDAGNQTGPVDYALTVTHY